MSKKGKVFRHVDDWFSAIESMKDDVQITGVFFKHGQKLHVQRMVGLVFMDYHSLLPDGSDFTSRGSQAASWDWNGQCRIKQKRCSTFDIKFADEVGV